MPNHCMVFKKSIASAGKKKMKTRITVAFNCSMMGSDKLTPLVIGTSKKPRCFKGMKNLSINLMSNWNAWMTGSVFEGYLPEWDVQLCMKNKKMALILDNCMAHPNLFPGNINFVFLPPTATLIIQPLGQGIIKTFLKHTDLISEKKLLAW